MRGAGGRAGFASAVLAALLLPAAGSWGQPPGSIPPIFTQRLQIPVRGDDLEQPRSVVADLHSGEVMVCDVRRNRIVIFDPQGRFRYEIPGGTAFQSPVDLAVDPEGYLFVLSQVSSEITLLDFDGRLIRKTPLIGLPERAEQPRFSSLAISPDGDRLYAMDAENHRLWITDREGVIQGSVDTTAGRPVEEIDELRYGHVDIYGDTVLLPIPSDGLVHLFDLEGVARGTIGAPGSAECQTQFPAAAALDEAGRVIILDQQRAMFMTWDLERGVCLSEHYGFGNAPGAFYQPSDMALDGAGRLYVSQGFEGRVQVYEGANPAPLRMAARQPPAEIVEETLVADAEIGRREAVLEPAQPVAEPAPAPPVAEPAPTPQAIVPRPAPQAVVPAPTPTAVEAVPEPAQPVAEPVPAPPAVVPAPVPPPIVPAPVPPPVEPAPVPAPDLAPPVEPVIAAAAEESSELAARLVAGARLSVDRAPRYDPTYGEIAYPGGDLPLDRGGAVDLVVRAFRHAGIDLQQTLQEDRSAAPAAYPINEPDPSIDHRRIRNLVPLFERRAAPLAGGPDGDWAPGDVVFWDRNSDGVAGHLGIVTDQTGPSGELLVAHHHRPTDEFPGTPVLGDDLLRWPVVGHYRWTSMAAPDVPTPTVTAAAQPTPTPTPAPAAAPTATPPAPAPTPASAPPPAPAASAIQSEAAAEVERTVRAWAKAWADKRIEDYLSFYSDSFDTGRELDRAGWERLRRVRLDRPRWIEVILAQVEPRVSAEDRAQVAFIQIYRSDLFADTVDKILVLERQPAGWKILSERVVRTGSE